MPKSKRNKIVSLAKTAKKGKERKISLVNEVRACVDSHSHVYLFSVDNMRNIRLQDLRSSWEDSRFYFGKNRVMKIAFGKTESDSYKENLFEVSNRLVGNCGLLITDANQEKVQQFFEEYSYPEFARAGNRATHDFVLPTGVLATIPFSMEPTLRSLNMPTSLVNGKVMLQSDHVVCRKGDVLTPEQFKIHAVWNNGTFTILSNNDNAASVYESDEEMDD